MDEYTIRIESDGVELWHRTFDYIPMINTVWGYVGGDWQQAFSHTMPIFDASLCYTILHDCNSIPGQCTAGQVYLDHIWKLIA